MSQKKKLLVTGATGFIGRNMAEYFAKQGEYQVFGTYNKTRPPMIPGVEFLKADLTNQADVERVMDGMDTLIQAAATTSGAKDIINIPYYHVTDNAVMNALLFRAAHKFNLQTVVFFSCTVMYQSSDRALTEEDYDGKPVTSKYFGVGETKVYNEKMCDFFSRISNTRYLVLRHSNVYGPYDKYDLEKSHVFGATITKVLTNTTGKMTVWGDGSDVRDFIHVDDLVKFVDVALKNKKQKFELYNVGGDEHITIADLVRSIIRLSGKNIEIQFDTSMPSIGTKVWLDISKAKNAFSWKPAIKLEEGIQKTIHWYRDYFKTELKNIDRTVDRTL